MGILKIAFVGTHGTGKTTLCYELAAWMKKREARVDMVREIARRCPLPINQETTLDAQTWILHRQIAEEIQMANEQDVVICDRSVLDNYAYLVQRMGLQPVIDDLVQHWMRTYTHLFKVPIVTPPVFDGTRDTSQAFQMAIDKQVDDLLTRFSIGVIPLDPRSRPTWIESVAEVIGVPPKPPQLGLFAPGPEEAPSGSAPDGAPDTVG